MTRLTDAERTVGRFAEAPDRVYRLGDVSALVGLSGSTIVRLRKLGSFPAPIRLTGQSLGWKASEIQQWIQSRETA